MASTSSNRQPSSFDGVVSSPVDDVNFIEKCIQNCKEQPLVPLGTLATTVAVILAARNLRIGNRNSAQKWFRYRVGFQGFTIAALVVGGLIYGKDSVERKKTQDELALEKSKLREKLWIEELERRDFEAKQRKKRAEIARQKYKEAMEAEKLAEEEEAKKKESSAA
ncbi:hypothetical protein WICPIJ_007819 [Wickerhamomyces pijperi]|uniref:Respiratory supercomplex factor 1, mitochondrial n=1 Tax=Wickerhamomyces pijperi TaxID=599730 RepID=A0A9P8PZH8_WICPI|nr:hypothetical protein WICPIJ_007819 [Wickerhamomyces pijperi]